MLSGIGPREHLEKYNIPLVQNIAGVGQNMQDHLTVNISYKFEKLKTFKELMTPIKMLKNLLQYFAKHSGLLTYPASDIGVFFKTNNAVETPNAQIHFAPGAGQYNKNGAMTPVSGMTASVCNLRPESRGHIELRSADPEDAPKIFANYLATKHDMNTMIEGVKKVREIFKMQAIKTFDAVELAPGEACTKDEDIQQFIRNESLSVYHPVGTCKMGSGDDCVVDDQLKVKGINGLRIADASIFPRIISGNTNATCNIIGAKCADFILKEK